MNHDIYNPTKVRAIVEAKDAEIIKLKAELTAAREMSNLEKISDNWGNDIIKKLQSLLIDRRAELNATARAAGFENAEAVKEGLPHLMKAIVADKHEAETKLAAEVAKNQDVEEFVAVRADILRYGKENESLRAKLAIAMEALSQWQIKDDQGNYPDEVQVYEPTLHPIAQRALAAITNPAAAEKTTQQDQS